MVKDKLDRIGNEIEGTKMIISSTDEELNVNIDDHRKKRFERIRNSDLETNNERMKGKEEKDKKRMKKEN